MIIIYSKKKKTEHHSLRNFEYCMKRYTIILASKRKSHLWQNINSLDCEPTIKVLWAYCLVVTCCLWGGDVILVAYVETISQSELATVPLWPMRGPRLCHIVVTSVTMLAQSTICTRPLMDSAASKFYTNGHQGPGLTTVHCVHCSDQDICAHVPGIERAITSSDGEQKLCQDI